MIEQRANASPGIVALRAGLAWTLCWLDRRDEARGDPQAGGERPLRARLAGVGRAARRWCCTPMQQSRRATSTPARSCTSASSHSPIRSTGMLLPPGDTHACTWACSPQSWANTSKPISTWRSRASSTKPTACCCRPRARSWDGRKRSPHEAMLPRAREHAARALELSREHGYGLFEQRAAALVETQSAAETDRR